MTTTGTNFTYNQFTAGTAIVASETNANNSAIGRCVYAGFERHKVAYCVSGYWRCDVEWGYDVEWSDDALWSDDD